MYLIKFDLMTTTTTIMVVLVLVMTMIMIIVLMVVMMSMKLVTMNETIKQNGKDHKIRVCNQ